MTLKLLVTIQEQGACVGSDVVFFFEDLVPYSRRWIEATTTAKQVCRTCGVQSQCLEYAKAAGEPEGLWGGLTEYERRPMLKQGTPKRQRAKDVIYPKPDLPPVDPDRVPARRFA